MSMTMGKGGIFCELFEKKKDNGDMAVHRMLDLLSSSLRERVSILEIMTVLVFYCRVTNNHTHCGLKHTFLVS